MIAVRETRPCDSCGKAVSKLLSQVKPGAKGWYCSRSCRARKVSEGKLNERWKISPAVWETRTCDNCQSPSTKKMSQVKHGASWACSRQCAYALRKGKPVKYSARRGPGKSLKGDTIPCLQCDKDFYREPYLISQGQRYCSKSCADEASRRNQVTKVCPTCGTEFRKSPSQAVRIYCSKLCETKANIKRPLGRMYNGRNVKKDNHGYVMIWEPSHPRKAFHGWQYEHRFLVEKSIGRMLEKSEHVHHINGVKDDNRLENLEIMDANDHARLSVQDYRDQIKRELAELEEYRKRFGSLV
jgi:endogenous inhibitor of DNA gyrase (YacG/DUF329 family)